MSDQGPFVMSRYLNREDLHNAMQARITQLEQELKEQCRLNGMGASRELKLMAERDALKARVKRLEERETLIAKELGTCDGGQFVFDMLEDIKALKTRCERYRKVLKYIDQENGDLADKIVCLSIIESFKRRASAALAEEGEK